MFPRRFVFLTTLLLLLTGFEPIFSYEEPDLLLDLHLSSTISVTNSCSDDITCVNSFTKAECLALGICQLRCPNGSRTSFPEMNLLLNSTTCQDSLICGLPSAADQSNGRYYVDGSMDTPCSISHTVTTSGLTNLFTISFWVQGYCATKCTLLSVGGYGLLFLSQEKLVINDKSLTTWPNVSRLDWTHVVISKRSSNLHLYMDGKKQDFSRFIVLPILESGTFEMGTTEALNNSSDFYRLVDARMYTNALTDREVESLFTGNLSAVGDVDECRCPVSHTIVEADGVNCTDGASSVPRLELVFHDAGAMLDGDVSTSWASQNVGTVNIFINLGNSFQVTEVSVSFNETGASPGTSAWRFNGGSPTFHTCNLTTCLLDSSLTDDNYRVPMTTNLRIEFQTTSDLKFFIHSIHITGRCDCGGAASECIKSPYSPDYKCSCLNNTAGLHCGDCQYPFYRYTSSDLQCNGVCRCNPKHSLACNQIGGRCTCKDNVEDSYCDSCKFFHYNLAESNPQGCKECVCNRTGTRYCNYYTGDCYCKGNVTGTLCDACLPGHYWRTPHYWIGCESCECNINGTVGGDCDPNTRQCSCKPNVQGLRCDECAEGFFNLTDISDEGCSPCNCNVSGTVGGNNTCDTDTGQCQCLRNYTGTKCDECADGFYNATGSNECIPCDCNTNGTYNVSFSCDWEGQCDCIENVTGLRCDRCADTFYEMEEGDLKSCSPCDCDVTGSTDNGLCDGIGNCSCKENVEGPKCQACVSGFYNLTMESVSCVPCGCHIDGSTDVTCHNLNGQCQCKPAVTGQRCDMCESGYHSLGSDDVNGCTSCDCDVTRTVGGSLTCNETGQCDCQPNVQGLRCSGCMKGYYTAPDSDDGCIPCNCTVYGVIDRNDTCNHATGQCDCLASVTGQQCDVCRDGYYNIDHETGTGCTACVCHSVGSIGCDKENGTCFCRTNVGGMTCDQCPEMSFDLTDSGCKECNCDTSGTESCDNFTGVCKCLPNVTGSRCDHCIIGHYGIESNSGCLPCTGDLSSNTSSECEDLINTICPTAVQTTSNSTVPVSLGENCASSFCGPTNSACVTKSDSSRICECQKNHIQMNETSCQRGPDVITQNSKYIFTSSKDSTGTVGFIPFDGLADAVELITVSVDMIPKYDNIVINVTSDNLTIELSSPLTTSSAFALVLSGVTADGLFDIQQVIGVHMDLSFTVTEHIQVLLVTGARRNTLLAEMRSLDFFEKTKDYKFELKSVSEDSKSLFTVHEKSGRVTCNRDLTLEENVLAKDYRFNITASGTDFVEQTIAVVDVLVIRDEMTVSVDEGFTGEIMKAEIWSDNFVISWEESVPDIKLVNGSFNLIRARDYQIKEERQTDVRLAFRSEDYAIQTSVNVTVRVTDVNDKRPTFKGTEKTEVYIISGSSSGTLIAVVSSTDPDTVGDVTYRLNGKHSADFRIDRSGVITALVKLEKKKFGDSFTLSVSADDGINQSEKNAEIHVNLDTAYESIKKDLKMTFEVNVTEHDPVGTFVLNVSVENYNDFKFLYPSTNIPFYLNASTSEMKISREIDRESTFNYWLDNLKIVGFEETGDRCNPVQIGDLRVNIIDINDHKPNFTESVYSGTVTEEEEKGALVTVDIRVYDEDIGPNAELTLSVNHSAFSVSEQNGKVVIKTEKVLDRETIPNYVLKLTAVDNPINETSRKTGTAVVNIRVADINDNAPTYVRPPDVLYVVENSIKQSVTKLNVTDEDEGSNATISFNIQGGVGVFSIDSSGELSTTGSVDRETHPEFKLIIKASDNGPLGTKQSSELHLTVYVNDTNDNTPAFDKGQTLFEVFENVDCKSLNVTIVAKDPDKDLNGKVSYYLNHSKFSINETTGVITCTSTLDYEEKKKYSLVVVAKDNAVEPLSSSITIEIQIKDVNDNAPNFLPLIRNTALTRSDLKIGDFILFVQTTDADSGINGQVYLALSGNGSDKFVFRGGILQVSEVPDIDVYNLTITATDNGNPPMSNSTWVEVKIEDDVAGKTQLELKEIQVLEGHYSGETLASLTAENLTSFTLSNDYSGLFTMNQNSGNLSCSGELDRETLDTYVIFVNATTIDTGLRQLVVLLKVLDINDNPPEFTRGSLQLNSVPEDASNNTFIQVLDATDPDAGENGEEGFHYVIINSDIPFAVDEHTGFLTTRGHLDRESVASYLIRVQVTDGGNPPQSATVNVSITLDDVNDNPPKFNQESYSIAVPESSEIDSNLGVLTAADPDYDRNGTVTFLTRVVEMDDNSTLCPFTVESVQVNTTVSLGKVKLNELLDFETRKTYTCLLFAVDTCDGCSYTSHATLNVNVLDNNDNRPEFHRAPYKLNVTRYAIVGHVITNVTATDADTDDGNNVISYRIVNYKEFFSINNSTGVLTVRKDLILLQLDSVLLKIEAVDNPTKDQRLTSDTTITITIIDPNIRPWFPDSYSISVKEENVNSTLRLSMRAQDTIDNKTGDCNCTYNIKPSNFSDHFTISPDGTVSQEKSLDREKTGNMFELEIQATDSEKPRKTASAILKIRVEDINDNSPYFVARSYQFEINETVPVGSTIGQLSAVDEDEGVNAVFEFKGVSVDARLIVHPNGNITVKEELKTKNLSVEVIKFTAVVTDAEKKIHDAVPVNVTILPFNSNKPPVFTMQNYEAEVPFLSPQGTNLELDNFRAIDPDGDSVTYRIVAGNSRDIIDIDSETGRMSLKHLLEESIGNFISLTVEAVDDGDRPESGFCKVTVKVMDPESSVCVSERQLQIDSVQRETYLGLFIAMATLLALSFMTSIYTCYKWRAARAKAAFYESKSGGTKTKNKVQDPGQIRGYSGLDVSKRVEPNEYDRSAVLRDFSRGSVHNPGYISAGSRNIDQARCEPPSPPTPPTPQSPPEPASDYDQRLPPEPEPDYDKDPSRAIARKPTGNHHNFLAGSAPLHPQHQYRGYHPTHGYRNDNF